ncbi:MAG: hypothetical protein KAS88_06710, partial [Deltaproteobacteria bacterium]|nr:hypothetical protein [Deltaproteobacteria bacterium]
MKLIKKQSIAILFTVAVLICMAGCTGETNDVAPVEVPVDESPATRTVNVSYSFEVANLPEGAKKVRVWVPYPTESEDQDVLDMRV